MRASLAALCLLSAPVFGADEARVISSQPDSVSITIYRDFLALITETRTVDLPADAVTLEFDGVVETLIPQSAVVADTGRAVQEANYDFDRLSPAGLLRKSIGKQVTLTRTNRRTGKASQVAATIVSANGDGVVFSTLEGKEALHCSGLPEKLTFDEIPDNLKQKPTLSIHLAAGAAGKRQVRVSYIAQGFGWAADYVAHVNADTSRMDLSGWVTLRNFTGARFADAQVQVVAGRLNLLDAEEGGSSSIGDTSQYHNEKDLASARKERLEDLETDSGDDLDGLSYFQGCYPLGPPYFPVPRKMRREAMGVVDSILAQDLEEIVVTGFRGSLVERENLADYQMYRLPWKTELGARQTKQVAFLHKPDVTVDRFYGLRISADAEESEVDQSDDRMHLHIRIGWKNTKTDGLGEPLPGGIVRIFDRNGGESVFAGEDSIEDTPVGVPSEITIGRSPDVTLAMQGEPEDPIPTALSFLTKRVYMPMELTITNAKPRPVVVEIRQGYLFESTDLRVVDANLPATRKSGDFAWRFTLPANGERQLTYRVGGKVQDYRDFED